MINEWEQETNHSIIDANNEMNGAKQLRSYIDALIKQTIDGLNGQKDITNKAFKRRIEQTQEAKTKLELRHSEVCTIKSLHLRYALNSCVFFYDVPFLIILLIEKFYFYYFCTTFTTFVSVIYINSFVDSNTSCCYVKQYRTNKSFYS